MAKWLGPSRFHLKQKGVEIERMAFKNKHQFINKKSG